jgi:hypothetical protein
MKSIFLIILCSALFYQISAQKIVEESLSVSKDQEIKLDFDFATDIKVNSWNKAEVYVKAIVNLNDGKDNEKFHFITKKGSDFVSIESEIKDLDKMYQNCTTIIIEDGDTTIINGGHNHFDLNFEVFMPSSHKLNLSTINGDIELVGLSGPMEINTINGEIDLHLNPSQKADLEMSSINGTFYTNFDLDLEDRKDKLCRVGGNVHTQLNGGGKSIELETINGAIFLRKAR